MQLRELCTIRWQSITDLFDMIIRCDNGKNHSLVNKKSGGLNRSVQRRVREHRLVFYIPVSFLAWC